MESTSKKFLVFANLRDGAKAEFRALRLSIYLWSVFLLLGAPAFGQSVSVSPDKTVAAWDPESDFQLFRSLGDQQIQAGIGLSHRAVSAYVAIRARHTREYRLSQPADRAAMQKRHRGEAIELLEELLTPNQKKRLKQLNYRIEIATIGLAEYYATKSRQQLAFDAQKKAQVEEVNR